MSGAGSERRPGFLGIVQRYLSRDSVMVKGEAIKLEKVLGGEGRIAVRVGAAREMISAAQEELRFVPGEGEPAQRAAQAALARLGTAQMELAAVFGAVGNRGTRTCCPMFPAWIAAGSRSLRR